jgi:hypothetical protein
MLKWISKILVVIVVKTGSQVGRSWKVGPWRRQVLAQFMESPYDAQS